MLVNNYINTSIPTLATQDTVKQALKKFDSANLNQLPVLEGESFLGLLSRTTAESVIDPKSKLDGIRLEGRSLNITKDTHVLEALKNAAENDLEVLGIVDATTQHYLGAITKKDLEEYFANLHSTKANGSIIVLSILERDYSLHELARIIESNGAKILSLFSETRDDDPYNILVTFKLNMPDLSRVIAALQRHNYNVVYTFHREEFLSKEKERLEHLLRFLEI